MRRNLKFIMLNWVLAACSDISHQETAHSNLQVDTVSQNNTAQKAVVTSQSTEINNDTIFVAKRAAIFVEPDSLMIGKQKQLGEKDFYAVAGDYLFYVGTAREFLDSAKLTTLNVEGKRFIKFIHRDKTHQIVDVSKLPELWNIYFFDPTKKAKQVDMTMIEEEYKSYFE